MAEGDLYKEERAVTEGEMPDVKAGGMRSMNPLDDGRNEGYTRSWVAAAYGERGWV